MLLTLLAQDRLVYDHAGNVGTREMMRMDSDFNASGTAATRARSGSEWRRRSAPERDATGAWNEDTTPVPPPLNSTDDMAVSKIGQATFPKGRRSSATGSSCGP